MNDLDIQFDAVACQFLAGQLKGRHQSRLPGHATAQSSALAGVKAEDGQFGVEAAAVSWALAFAWQRGAVKGGKPQDESAQQADTTAARFALAEGAAGLFYFFWAASPQAG